MIPDTVARAILAARMAYEVGTHDPEDTESLTYVAFTEKEFALVLLSFAVFAAEVHNTDFGAISIDVFGDLMQKMEEVNLAKMGE